MGWEVPELPKAYPFGGMFGALPAYSLYARHVNGLSISNWRTRWQSPDVRPAAVFDDVSDLQVVGFHAAAARGQRAVMLCDHSSKALLQAVTAEHATAASMVRIGGKTSPSNRRR